MHVVRCMFSCIYATCCNAHNNVRIYLKLSKKQFFFPFLINAIHKLNIKLLLPKACTCSDSDIDTDRDSNSNIDMCIYNICGCVLPKKETKNLVWERNKTV